MLRFWPLVLALATQLPQAPVGQPFTAGDDAKEQIAAAIHMAATDDIRVLVVWGANDDSRSMSYDTARKSPEIARAGFFSDEYKLVQVNVGHLDKNIELAKSYGAVLTSGTLPAFTVLDDQGRPVAQSSAAELAAADGRVDPAKLAGFLKSHQAPAPDAVAPFEAAVKQAKASGQYVFLWFSAPW